MNKKTHLWDTFDTVTPTTIPPTKGQPDTAKYSDILTQIEGLYEQNNVAEFYQYKKGALLQPSSTADYTQFLQHFVKLIFQCVREEVQRTIDNEEEKKDTLVKMSN